MNFTQMDKEGLPPFLSNDAVMFLQQSHSIFSLMTLEYEDRLWELLMEAVTDDNLEAVEYLVDRGAPWLVRDWEDPPLDIPGLKLTGLSFSCYHGSPRVATYFIFHFPQENLEPCLLLAIHAQHIKIVEILLDYDIDFQSGLNPILLSLSNYKLLQLLIEYVKVDKSLVKRMLLTAFEHVIANGNEQLVRFFVGTVDRQDLGLPLMHEDSKDVRPIQVAVENRQWHLVRFFLDNFYDMTKTRRDSWTFA